MMIKLSGAQESRAREIHRKAIVIAGHTDYISDIAHRRRIGERSVFVRRHLSTLRQGGVTAVCEHLGGDAPYYIAFPSMSRIPPNPLKHGLQALDHIWSETEESPESLIVALTVDDIRVAKEEEKVAWVLCFEGAMPIEDDLAILRSFHKLGVRCIGLTWNHRNLLADGLGVGSGGGLTRFGIEAVEEMNQIGIVVDVSHLSPEGFWDVLEVSEKPIVASHSNAASVRPHERSLTNGMIKGLAQGGGVIGIHALSEFLSRSPKATLEELLDHVDHISTLVGPEHVGIGPDILEDWPGDLYKQIWAGSEAAQLEMVYPDDFDSLGKFLNVTRGLVSRGYSDEEIEGVLGGNWLRVLEDVWSPGTDAVGGREATG
jgi:membrane dipeptidase